MSRLHSQPSEPYSHVPPTGKRVRVTFMNLDRFADGKLVEHRVQVDMFGLMQQLGVVPSWERPPRSLSYALGAVSTRQIQLSGR